MARVAFKIAAFGMVLFAAQTARAQTVGGSASGGVSAGATATPQPPAPPPPPATPAPPPAAATTSASATGAANASPTLAPPQDDDNTPDHERLIGHFGVGYMGISQLPIAGLGGGAAAALTKNTVTAPVIGVRYWFSRMIGLDAGIGFGLASGGTTTDPGTGTTVSTDNPSSLGAALHGGVPFAFANGKHYSFELVPELNVGFTSGTIKAAAAGGPDTNLSGFRLDVGARVGGEIYFGFIGIPQLALQASVGAYFSHQAWKASVNNASVSANTNALGTSVESDPWALFVNNISALYYF
ncbi:MAG: hypothetical protein ACRELY_28710 [Polyangiaceae bacterium]